MTRASKMPNIEFTPVKMRRFKKRCYQTIKAGETIFTFEGHEILVSYAKYMIEYLESMFAGRRA